MIGRRIVAVVVGLLLVGGALQVRDEGGPPGPGRREERLAEVRALQRATPEDLRGLSAHEIAFDPEYEDVPTAVCSADLGEGCTRLARLGFEVRSESPWATAAAARDGGVDAHVWVGPTALVDRALGPGDGGLVTEDAAFVDSRVAGVTRAGGDVAEACERSSTPLTCLVTEADRVATPDPATSVAGTAVLVALAHEAGGSAPEHLAAAVEVLADAQVTHAPIAELLEVDVPEGEVALGTDAPVAAAFRPLLEDEDGPAVAVRWSRTSDAVPLALAADASHPQIHRIRALLRSDGLRFAFEQAGFLSVDDPWVDPDTPMGARPAQGAPVSAVDLEAARAAWSEAR